MHQAFKEIDVIWTISMPSSIQVAAEAKHQRKITVPAKYAEHETELPSNQSNAARNPHSLLSNYTVSPVPQETAAASRPKRAPKPKQHFDEIEDRPTSSTKAAPNSLPSESQPLSLSRHPPSGATRQSGLSAPLTLAPLQDGPLAMDLVMHQLLNPPSGLHPNPSFVPNNEYVMANNLTHINSHHLVPSNQRNAGPTSASGSGLNSNKGKAKKWRNSAPKRPAGSITLKCLIEAEIMQPGVKVLTLEYKGAVTRADLNREGQIRFNGACFESPSAFSIYVKRLVNPTRKADDGWKAVKYEGK